MDRDVSRLLGVATTVPRADAWSYALWGSAAFLSPPSRVHLAPPVAARHMAEEASDPMAIMENCFARGVFACGAGYAMGLFFGAAMAGFGAANIDAAQPASTDAKVVQAFREGLVQMKTRSLSTAKNFALVGAMFSTVECFLEKQRGRKDLKNSVATGAVTGALLAARAGPSAMLFGAGGFAVFSVVMETLLPNFMQLS